MPTKKKSSTQRRYRRRRYERDPDFLKRSLQRLRDYKNSRSLSSSSLPEAALSLLPIVTLTSPPPSSPSPPPPSLPLMERGGGGTSTYVVLQSPFTMIVSGPTMSGKTHFVSRLLDYRRKMMHPTPTHIWWFHGQKQKFHDQLESKLGSALTMLERFPTPEDLAAFKADPETPKLVVMDDLITSLSGPGKGKHEKKRLLNDMFMKISHHTNTSMIFISQTLFLDGALVHITQNASYVVLFKGSMAATQAKILSQRQYGKADYLGKIMQKPDIGDAGKSRHFYLFIDMRVNDITDPDTIAWLTNIFPDDGDNIGWKLLPSTQNAF